MRAKNDEKIQTLDHFSRCALGNKLRLSRNAMIFTDTSINIHIQDLQSVVAFRINLDLFWFFNRNVQNHNWCSARNCT